MPNTRISAYSGACWQSKEDAQNNFRNCVMIFKNRTERTSQGACIPKLYLHIHKAPAKVVSAYQFFFITLATQGEASELPTRQLRWHAAHGPNPSSTQSAAALSHPHKHAQTCRPYPRSAKECCQQRLAQPEAATIGCSRMPARCVNHTICRTQH